VPGRCDAVRVTYDPKRQRLGVAPGDPEARGTHPIDYWCQIQISSKKPFGFYRVDISKTRRCYCYDLGVLDGVLIANLGGA